MGGSIRGVIIVDKCKVDKSYTVESEYQACLNACYKGACAGACGGEGESETTGNSAEYAVTKKSVEMKGGTTDEFTNAFNEFNDKTNDFDSWIATLADNPAIVGGNLVTIHTALLTAIEQGQHNLNADSDVELTDDQWSAKLTALGQAYDYQNGIYASDGSYDYGECALTCPQGYKDSTSCTCECGASIDSCCEAADVNSNQASEIGLNHACFIICLYYILSSLL